MDRPPAVRGLFVTATDTGAGKTHTATRLIRALRDAGRDAVGFKPFCCGDRDDALQLAEASGLSIDKVNPFWYRVPAAPLAASFIENRPPDLDLVRGAHAQLASHHDFVVVEGAGGFLVPVTKDYSLADLAAEFAYPIIVVVPNRLGCLNHALLTREAILSRKLTFAGFILNGISPASDDPAELSNAEMLEMVSGGPLLGRIAFGEARLAPSAPLCALCGLNPDGQRPGAVDP